MRRRTLLAALVGGATLVAPSHGLAQPRSQSIRLGYLAPDAPPSGSFDHFA
jgi:hypothetical protein